MKNFRGALISISRIAIHLFALGYLSIFVACGGASNNASTLAANPYINSSIPAVAPATSTGSLPTNLFDNSTAGDQLPSTSTLTPGQAPSYANLCLGSNNGIFAGSSGFGTLTPTSGTTTPGYGSSTLIPGTSGSYGTNGSYCTGSPIDPGSLMSSGVQTMSDLFNCYQTVLSNVPVASDPQSTASAMQLGGMAITRCSRAYLSQVNQYAQPYGGWNPYQQQVFASTDGLLYIMLRAFSN